MDSGHVGPFRRSGPEVNESPPPPGLLIRSRLLAEQVNDGDLSYYCAQCERARRDRCSSSTKLQRQRQGEAAEWNLTVGFTEGGGKGGLSCSRSLLWGSFIGHMWLGCQIRRHDYTLALFVCVHACSCVRVQTVMRDDGCFMWRRAFLGVFVQQHNV